MKKITLFFLLSFVNVFSFAYNFMIVPVLADSLNVVVNEIAHADLYESAIVGFAGSPSQQNIRLIQLKQQASPPELIELTNNQSAIVRLYSFIALLDRHDSIPSEILNRLLNDKAVIVSLNGCIATEKTVGILVKQIISQRNPGKNL